MSGKKVIRNLFSGKPLEAMPVLIPIIPLGARIMQVTESSVAADPALAVQCALQIKQLLAPAGMVLYDLPSVTEAVGGVLQKSISLPEQVRQVGSISMMMETIQRLSATLGRDAAVFAAVPGPVELILAAAAQDDAGQYLSDNEIISALSRFLIDLAKEYMESRADGLIVVESKSHFVKEELAEVYSQFLTTVGNMAGYYGIPLVIYLYGQEEITALPLKVASLNFKGMLLDDSPEPGSLSEALSSVKNRVFGLTVPENLLLPNSAGLHEYFKRRFHELTGKPCMFSVPWKMTGELSMSQVVEMNDLVKKTGRVS